MPSIKEYPCLACAELFASPQQLQRHIADTYHYQIKQIPTTQNECLYLYLNALYQEQVVLLKTDRRRSRIVVKEIIKELMKSVTSQKGGQLYSGNLTTAGSISTTTKIGKADEFDYNIPLALKSCAIETSENVFYKFIDHTVDEPNLNYLPDNKAIIHSPVGKKIPDGYCTVWTPNNSVRGIWKLKHDGDLIPRYVHEDLYNKLTKAIQQRRQDDIDVKLQKFPHGPALTVIIKYNHPCPEIKHDISVDFAASVKCQGFSEAFPDWPTEKTAACLGQKLISEVMFEGVHLVPKTSLFWYISYSNASKVLLNRLDKWDECRRKCHKILKRDFQIWKSQSEHGFKGISTYVFKHHLFWMNEKRCIKENYWKEENIGKCYRDVLNDLARTLVEGVLWNYFNKTENILKKKNKVVLKELAECMKQRANQLLHIKVVDTKTHTQ